jgi:hypothetical protein
VVRYWLKEPKMKRPQLEGWRKAGHSTHSQEFAYCEALTACSWMSPPLTCRRPRLSYKKTCCTIINWQEVMTVHTCWTFKLWSKPAHYLIYLYISCAATSWQRFRSAGIRCLHT